MEFRENSVRGRDGCLLRVEEIWHAEAERHGMRRAVVGVGLGDHGVDFVHATADSVDEVWAKLRRRAELADVRRADQAAVS